jgi:hypothetical protein
MSTFTGDATITDVISASASLAGPINTTSVLYTCPAGHFAEVYLVGAGASNMGTFHNTSNATIGPYTIFTTSGSQPDVGQDFRDIPTLLLINEGESVTITLSDSAAAQISMTVRIKEYTKP